MEPPPIGSYIVDANRKATAEDLAYRSPSAASSAMLVGLLMFVGGIVAAAWSASAAADGGHYVIFVGLIVVGLFRFVQGAMSM